MYVAQLLHGGPHIEMKVLFRPEASEAPALKYPQLETTVESHPFDFAQGRLRAQNALGWGTLCRGAVCTGASGWCTSRTVSLFGEEFR